MNTDYIVVGGSFAGLAAALQLARARRKVHVIDAGLPRNRFAASSHGFLGHDGRDPRAIMLDARSQLAHYPSVTFQQGVAVRAAQEEGGFVLALESGAQLSCKRLILATGVVDQLPDLPGLRERWGVSVLHCPYCHGLEVQDQRLGVLGLAAHAAFSAQLIADWTDKLTFFANGLEIAADQLAALSARGVRVEHRRVVAVEGAAPALDAVLLEDGTRVPIDALFAGAPVAMASPLAEQLGCAFEEGPLGQFVRTDQFKETTVKGVFAAGDMARMPHNATWAAADGVSAGASAHRSMVFSQA